MRLGGLDTAVLMVSLIAAVLLYLIRWKNEIAAAPGQGLFDMLGIWTTIELVLIALASLQQDMLRGSGITLPDPAEIIRSNGPLVPIALFYSAILVARSSFVTSIAAATGDEKAKVRAQETT